MNRKILNKLLVCALVLNVASPVFNAAELGSELLAGSDVTTTEVSSEDTTSEVTSEDTTSEVTSEDTTSEVTSEDTTEEVTSEDATEEVTSEDTTSEVTSEDTTSEVTSEDTTSEVTSEDTTDEVEKTAGDVGDNDFFISGDLILGDESTGLNEAVSTEFTVMTYSGTALVAGSTIDLVAPAGIEVSDIVVTNEETGSTLVKGTDYSLDGTTITLLTDLAFGDDLNVSYSAKMLNATTDILGATSSIFVDYNDNGTLDGKDYYIQSPGLDIVVTNGDVTETDYSRFDSELVGGAVDVENTKVTRKHADGVITGQADYTITNSGRYAIDMMSLYQDFDVVADSDDYYVYGVYTSTDDMLFSVDGTNFMSHDELRNSFDSSAAEYLNPGDELEVQVPFEIDKDMTEANLDDYDFGSWKNFTKHAKAQFTLDTTYADNIFGQELSSPKEIVLTDSLYVKPAEKVEEEKDTDEAVTEPTEDKTSKDADASEYTQMELGDENQTLAHTGSLAMASILSLIVVLILAFVAKLKVSLK